MLLLLCSLVLLGALVLFIRFVDASRRKSLYSQAGVTNIHGQAAHSLQTEKMRIRKTNRDKGVIGELGVAKDLDYLAVEYGLTVLHDLSIPGSKANIDHILITRKVVYVIDAKNYTGLVKIGPGRDGIKRLTVGGRNQTQLAEKLKGYSELIEEYLTSVRIEVKVIPMLAFYQAKFHDSSKLTINGVLVNLYGIENELLRHANLKIQEIDIDQVAAKILEKFPPKN